MVHPSRGFRGVDTALIRTRIYTVDDDRPHAEALAIHHGRFVAVGTTAEVRDLIGPDTRVLELPGKTVVPGFIDAHAHALKSGILHETSVDCDLRSLDAILEALRERARRTPRDEWVQGFKFDDTKTDQARFLTRRDLDAVSTDHPVCVAHRAGHIGFYNSRALELAGIGRGTPDPPGGRYEREPGTGELTGVVLERAEEPLRELLPPVTREARRAGLRRICRMFHSAGLTSVHDAIVTDQDLRTYQEAAAEGDLSLRIYALVWHRHFRALEETGLRTGFGDDRLRIGGIKLIADGAIAGRTAWLSQPYEGSRTDFGIRAIEPGELEEQALRIHRAGFQICVHANGDAAIDMVLTAYEKAMSAHPRPDPRHRVEHCTVVTPGILERMKRLGCIATPFCTYVHYHGEKMRFYGEERLGRMFAQRSFLDAGIVSTGATDYWPGPYEPLMGIQSCVTRADMSGKVWGANQRITPEEALRVYTLHGAYASFEERDKGSIAPGKLADLVVLGEDPTRIDPHRIQHIPVERTVVGGRTVYEG
jgi:predicted amidohydrolase YtcJ